MNTKIWNNSFFRERSDIIINFNNSEYKLNKEVLKICKTFKDMFSVYEESSKGEIDITVDEINQKGWEMLLDYIYKEYKEFYNDIYGEMYDRENINFYNDEIKISEECRGLSGLSELSIMDRFELYIASDFFNCESLTEEIKKTIIPLYDNLIYNDINLLFQYMNYHPIISKLFISLFLLVKIENIEIIVKFIILCSSSNDNDLYFSNNDLINIVKKYFYIPNNIISFNELTNILKYKTEELSNLIDKKFFFCNFNVRSLLVNYFVLEYFTRDIDEIYGKFIRVASSCLLNTKQEKQRKPVFIDLTDNLINENILSSIIYKDKVSRYVAQSFDSVRCL